MGKHRFRQFTAPVPRHFGKKVYFSALSQHFVALPVPDAFELNKGGAG
jgi:hypothetical protein